MREHSKIAWSIAIRYGDVLSSETRDLAALIDAALADEKEACAQAVEGFPVGRMTELLARDWRTGSLQLRVDIAALIRARRNPST